MGEIHAIKTKNVIISLIVSKQQCSSLVSHLNKPDEYVIIQVNISAQAAQCSVANTSNYSAFILLSVVFRVAPLHYAQV